MAAELNPQQFRDLLRKLYDEHGMVLSGSGLPALMFAAVRLWPAGADGIMGMLDESRELTKPDWYAILERLAKSWKPGMGGSENPFHPRSQDDPPRPGFLEALRRLILLSLAREATRKLAKSDILEIVLDLAHTHDLFTKSIDPALLKLIVDLVQPQEKSAIYCGFDASALVALRLAAEGKAHVTFDAQSPTLSAVCACLSIAGDLPLLVRRGDPLELAQLDLVNSPLLEHGFATSVVMPPFGLRANKSFPALPQNPLPAATSSEAAGISLALARGTARAICLLPGGFLFRTSKAEQHFKERAIRDFGLDAVIGLPRGIVPGTSIATALLCFTAPAEPNRKRAAHPILMVDGRGEQETLNPNSGKRMPDNLAALVERHEQSKISISVTVEEIVANDFNLSVERYVLAPETRQMRAAMAKAITKPLDDLVELYRPQALPTLPDSPLLETHRLFEVGVADIDEAGLVRIPTKQIPATHDLLHYARRACLEPGDVLLVIKGSVGKVGLVRHVPENATWIASQSFAILRMRRHGPLIDPSVLHRFLSSPFGQATLHSLKAGVAVPGLAMADVRRLPILLPSMTEQNEICSEINRMFSLQDHIEDLRAERTQLQMTMWPPMLEERESEALPPVSPRKAKQKIVS